MSRRHRRLLGAARRADAEKPTNLVPASIDKIVAAAGVTFVPRGDDFPGRDQIVQQLGAQVAKHAQQIADVACGELAKVYAATLHAAARAIDKTPVDD